MTGLEKKLEKKLHEFIEYDSISCNNVHYETFIKDSKTEVYNDGSVTICNENLEMFSQVFEFTPENFIKNLNWKSEPCSQICRRKVGKKYKDFTTEDCLKYLDYWSNRRMINYIECSPFGTGSDIQWNWSVFTVDGKEYFMYYGRD